MRIPTANSDLNYFGQESYFMGCRATRLKWVVRATIRAKRGDRLECKIRAAWLAMIHGGPTTNRHRHAAATLRSTRRIIAI